MASLPFRARLAGVFLLALIAVADQWTKTAILAQADAGALPRELLPVLNLVLVKNRGISFGILAHMQSYMPLVLTLITSSIAFLLAVWLVRARDNPTALALGLIIGGAVGNIADRVRFHAVTDFLDFHWKAHHWPAFNLADSAVFIGVVILVFIGIVRPAKEKES